MFTRYASPSQTYLTPLRNLSVVIAQLWTGEGLRQATSKRRILARRCTGTRMCSVCHRIQVTCIALISSADSQKATYLVDKEEYTKAETELAALKKGPVDDLTRYKNNLKAKARRANEVCLTLCLLRASNDHTSSQKTLAASCVSKAT